MRVLHIITTLLSGGAEKMLVDIVEEMKKSGATVEVLVLSSNNDFFSKKIIELGIPVHFSPINRIYHPLQILQIRRYLKKRFDIVHTHLFAPQLFTAIANVFTARKSTLVTTEHNTHNRRRDKKYFKLMDSWMYKKYEKIIAISEATQIELNNYLPSTVHKTKVIQNGIQLEHYLEAKPLHRKALISDYHENEKLILMVAAMREQKDHETLIRASKLLPDNYHVLFVGDGHRLDEVKEYARGFGSEKIHFLGRRSDVASIMKTCDIFVLSSKWEGFGLVALEAMVAGLPVIVSNVPGLREVVTGRGSLFRPGDENDLKEKILTIDVHDRRETNYREFSISSTVKAYMELYKSLL